MMKKCLIALCLLVPVLANAELSMLKSTDTVDIDKLIKEKNLKFNNSFNRATNDTCIMYSQGESEDLNIEIIYAFTKKDNKLIAVQEPVLLSEAAFAKNIKELSKKYGQPEIRGSQYEWNDKNNPNLVKDGYYLLGLDTMKNGNYILAYSFADFRKECYLPER